MARKFGNNKDSRYVLHPRMVYDEWTPLGRGDPLKNDPTYDYVPPALDKVHYWLGPSSRIPDTPQPTASNSRTDPKVGKIFQRRPIDLGTSSEDSKIGVYETYFNKISNVPKFSSIMYRNNYQHYPYYHYRRPSTPSSLSNKQRVRFVPTYQYYQYKPQQKQRPYKNNSYYDRDQQKEDEKIVYESSISTIEAQVRTHPNISHIEEPILHNDEKDDLYIYEDQGPYVFLVPPPLQIPNSFILVSELNQPNSNNSSTSTLSSTQSSVSSQEDLILHSSTMLYPMWEEDKTSTSSIEEKISHTWKSPFKFVFGDEETDDEEPANFPYIDVASVDNVQFNSFSSDVNMLPTTELYVNNSSDVNSHGYPDSLWNTTTVSPTITTSSSLTTDPIFSHYKQPAEPFRGPFYIIFQGHSKVKNYSPSKYHLIYHGIPLQQSNYTGN